MSLSVLGPCEFAAATGDMCHGFCMLFAQPASWILHSVVDLACHCPGVEGLLLSCNDQSLGVVVVPAVAVVVLVVPAVLVGSSSNRSNNSSRNSIVVIQI